MSIRHTHSFRIPAAHPTAALHFPGLAVIPGALLLDEAATIIAGSAALRFRTVKFLAPVRHGETLELTWQTGNGNLLSFEMHRAGETAPVLTGTLERMA
jgi:3-hydroxymyristoyl/3-hydroxydecanoyl-(acyl carrier protein) dehydratase